MTLREKPSSTRKGTNGDRQALRVSRAVSLFLDGLTLADIAKRMAVHRNTVATWLKTTEAQEALSVKRAAMLEAAGDGILRLGPKAVERLEGLLDAESEGVQVSACARVLSTLVALFRSTRAPKLSVGTMNVDQRTAILGSATGTAPSVSTTPPDAPAPLQLEAHAEPTDPDAPAPPPPPPPGPDGWF